MKNSKDTKLHTQIKYSSKMYMRDLLELLSTVMKKLPVTDTQYKSIRNIKTKYHNNYLYVLPKMPYKKDIVKNKNYIEAKQC